MPQSQSSGMVDPELVRQMNEVAASDKPVEAVVRLRADDPSEIVPSPERTEELAEKVLKRVAKRSGNPKTRYNVFKNLGSFFVSAPTEFVRELISQPEVAAAVANRQPDSPDSALISPVEKKPLREEERKTSTSSKTRTPSNKKRAVRHHKLGR
jgi:hypothetical protein